MAFERHTAVSGSQKSGREVVGWLAGHWQPDRALRWARSQGAVGAVKITTKTIDTSGRGYSGDEGKWLSDAADNLSIIGGKTGL